MTRTGPEDDRLDSWKAICEYLRRDIRTLQRWEAQGLPIRRVAVGRGASVFAYKSELDQWLRAGGAAASRAPALQLERATAVQPERAPEQVPQSSENLAPPVAQLAQTGGPVAAKTVNYACPSRRWWIVAACGAAVVLAVIAWRGLSTSAHEPIRVDVTADRIRTTTVSGRSLWAFDFPLDEKAALSSTPVIALPGHPDETLVMTAHAEKRRDHSPLSGVMRWFSPSGAVLRSFYFPDRWSFAGVDYGEPWVLTDAEASKTLPLRIVVAAHHDTWWPSVVTVLDDQFSRHGTFVNSGWVINTRWLDAERIAISGFNEELDGGMLAILDANHLDGASPDRAGGEYACDQCGSARPLFYAVFPRSEVNKVTAGRFNGATFGVRRDRIEIHTSEASVDSGHQAVSEAVYEFSPSMELVHVSYGSDYWARHRELELQGVIHHTRDQCPERDGPPLINVWLPSQGWHTVSTSSPRHH